MLDLPGLAEYEIPGLVVAGIVGFALNASGTAVFVTQPFNIGAQPRVMGVFIAAGGTPVRIALDGEPAPDAPAGAVFGGFDPESLVINAQGDVAFLGSLVQNSGEVTEYSSGIWLYRNGRLRLVARQGDEAPGTAYRDPFSGFFELAINPTGEVAFQGRLGDSWEPAGLWRGTGPEDLRAVAVNGRASDRVPQPTGLGFSEILGSFSTPVFTKPGDLLFVADGENAGSAIWVDDDGVLQTIVKNGDIAGLGSGETFLSFGEFVANGEGRLAFTAQYTGSSVWGVWAEDSSGVPHLVGQLGDIIQVRDGTEIIRSISFLSGRGNVSGYGSGFSDNFELAVAISFQGGGAGIFRAMVDDVGRPPTASTDIFWTGACGDNYWHTACGPTETNWEDADGEPLLYPPGDAGNEVVTIAENLPADGVILQEQGAEIGRLTTDGTLVVRQRLTLNEDSTIASLVLDTSAGHVVVGGKLTLTGTGTALSSGTITLNGDQGIENLGTATAALPVGELPSQSMEPDIVFAGNAPWTNAERATFTQSLDILVDDHTDVPAIVNEEDATWSMKSATLAAGGSGSFVNDGRLVAAGKNSASDSFLDLYYEARTNGEIIVEEGTLTLRGGGSILGSGNPNIQLASPTSTFRLGGKEGAVRVTYRLLAGGHQFVAPATGGTMAVDDNAILEVTEGADVENMLVDTADGDAFQLNGTGEIVLGASFRNSGDFAWFGGTISTVGLIDLAPGVPEINSTPRLVNAGNITISGSELNTLAGLLMNTKVPGSTGSITLSSSLTIDGGELRNLGFVTLEEDSELVAGAAGGVLTNYGDVVVSPTETAGAGATATIATRLDNNGFVTVGDIFEAREATLVVSGPIDQLVGTVLTGGSWAVNSGSVLDLDGRTITQLGTETDRPAEISLRGTAQWPGLSLDRIEKTGRLSLQEGNSLILPGGLNNAGGLFVGDLSFGAETSGLRINGDFHQRGKLDIGGTLGMLPQLSQVQVHFGNVVFHQESETTINGELKVFTAGKTITVNGLLKGHGDINGERLAVIVEAGTVRVGNSPGTMTIDADFTLSTGGRLEIEVGGTEVGNNQDQLIINGAADIDGTVVLKFIDDFAPSAGDVFDFVNVSGTLTGRFAAVEIVDLAEGFEFAVSPTGTGFMMEAMNDGVFTGIVGEINDVEIGFSSPAAETDAAPGDTDVPMLQFEVTPEVDGLTISSLTLQAQGSGDDAADLAGVTVWADINGDGRVDRDDTALGVGTFETDNGTLVLSIDPPYQVEPRTTATLLITYDVAAEPEEAMADVRPIGDMNEAQSSQTPLPVGRGRVVGTGALAASLALIICVGLASPHRRRGGVVLCSVILAAALVSGCPGGDVGPVSTRVTFGVTLRAIGAQELVTNADASVNGLALTGTNLTVVR